ncbi:MAG: aminotransferase class I/II-fold pyridoxal phosphate-dependent enzyme [Anaerolineae bacterium]|nr:aminotransferase class I/II-fold pyridoxal phosphate-dependent enzyme [Anaerolineae bacterium]
MKLEQKSRKELGIFLTQYLSEFEALKAKDINLDLTRGKPSSKQLDLSVGLDSVLEENYINVNGVDTRNYGGLDGLVEAKQLFAPVLGVAPDEILIGGNSSLTLMYQYLNLATLFGANGPGSDWMGEGNPKFICPVPGYDRHFTICESLGLEMIPVPMTDQGPDMDAIFKLVKKDVSIKGLWCVPKYSNPTGVTYSREVVKLLAELPKVAGKNFRIMWDNAYALHDFEDELVIAPLLELAKKEGTQDSVVMFGSTSKVSFAGAGIGFMSASPSNLEFFKKYLSVQTIGPDKVNQWRHVKFFRDIVGLRVHMKKHAEIIRPKFQVVFSKLEELGELGIGGWLPTKGGYFVSFETLKGLASKIITLCGECGVKLTPAGSAFPYKNDPDDTNIRLAPSFPEISAIEEAMNVFVCCVKLASVQKLLESK